jgi:hypothetical protein
VNLGEGVLHDNHARRRAGTRNPDRISRLWPGATHAPEVWTWIECKKKNITPAIQARNPHAGDVWLWVAMGAHTKLVFSHRVGARTPPDAFAFVGGLGLCGAA